MRPTEFIYESCEHQNATSPCDFIGMARAYEFALASRNRLWIGRDTLVPFGMLIPLAARVLYREDVDFRMFPQRLLICP